MKNLFIIDASNYLYRSYFAIRKMTNEKGFSTNALFGFVRSVNKLIKDFDAKHLVVVFDGPDNKKSRVDVYEAYKSHRESMPDDLFPQIEKAKAFCDAAGISHFEAPGVEADDSIGSISTWAEQKGAHVYLCSSDKDLCQLVSEKVHVLNTFKDNLIIDPKKVEEIYGIRPDQMIDYLAIVGDTSDNIPGIRGFGPKAATTLLSKFDTLEALLKSPEKIGNPKKEAKVTEEKDTALLSQKLATIDCKIKVPSKEDFYEIKAPDIDKLRALYQEMNFNSLLRDLAKTASEEPSQSTPSTPKNTKPVQYQQIENLDQLKKLIEDLSKQKEIAFDVETTDIDPMRAEIIGIGLGYEEGKAWYIPFNADMKPDDIIKILCPFFTQKSPMFYGHNIKYDMHVLNRVNMAPISIAFDTMLASYLLNAHNNRHGLDDLALQHFGHSKISIKELTGAKKRSDVAMKDVALPEITNYCCEDIDFSIRLKNLFEKKLKDRKLDKLYFDIELPLLPILFQMEENGIYLDTDYMEDLSKDFTKKLKTIEKEIYDLAGEEFNIKSPKQLSEILFTRLKIRQLGKKTTLGHSTGSEVLKALQNEHPIIKKIMHFRMLEKLRSTYVDSLPKQIHPDTGRIHCSFNQSVTATGRLSSTNPNLQNIPVRTAEGKKVRTAFKPQKEGWSYISADYSQIELRILAHMSGDESLIKAFKHDEDIHSFTAAKVYDIAPSAVTKEMRSKAKAVNFGLIYGQQAFGLSKELGIDIREASEFITAYFKQYPIVKNFIESCKEQAIKEGRATSLYGRQRLLPEINSRNAMHRNASLRLAVNTPIQGTQADIIKAAMIKIDNFLTSSTSDVMMILQIHDELIFECPDNKLSMCKKNIQTIMESIVSLKVPLKVDISVGKNWGEC